MAGAKAKEVFPPFGIKDKLGYLFGDFGNDFTFILSSSFLLKFYTDVANATKAATISRPKSTFSILSKI